MRSAECGMRSSRHLLTRSRLTCGGPALADPRRPRLRRGARSVPEAGPTLRTIQVYTIGQKEPGGARKLYTDSGRLDGEGDCKQRGRKELEAANFFAGPRRFGLVWSS